eukprot:15160257-Alexandrium_andersonii.AAC.1
MKLVGIVVMLLGVFVSIMQCAMDLFCFLLKPMGVLVLVWGVFMTPERAVDRWHMWQFDSDWNWLRQF